MTPTILITRPDPAGAQFADAIRQQIGCGVAIEISPLMKIVFAGELPDLDGITRLIFTSRNGVEAFARASDRRDITCYCVGDATAQVARDHGLTAISSSGAADDLVARVQSDAVTGPCLHIRGDRSVGDIARRLGASGIPTSEAVLYRQVPNPLSDQAQRLFRGDGPVILPLFSPRTAQLFFANGMGRPRMTVVALSAAVAAMVPDGFDGELIVAERPDAAAMLDVIQRLVDQGKSLETGKRAQ